MASINLGRNCERSFFRKNFWCDICVTEQEKRTLSHGHIALRICNTIYGPPRSHRSPRLVEPRFELAVNTQDGIPALAGNGLHPLVLLIRRCLRPDSVDTNSSRAHTKWFGVRTPKGKIWTTDFFFAAPALEDLDHFALSRLVQGQLANTLQEVLKNRPEKS